MNNNEIKNDNEYMEFSNMMKEQYDQLKKENKKLKKKIYDYQKEFCSIYGVLRIIDFMASELINIPNVLIELIERQRGALSDLVEKDIIKYVDEDQEELDEEEQIIVQMVLNEE